MIKANPMEIFLLPWA